jgi:hypothetical protein
VRCLITRSTFRSTRAGSNGPPVNGRECHRIAAWQNALVARPPAITRVSAATMSNSAPPPRRVFGLLCGICYWAMLGKDAPVFCVGVGTHLGSPRRIRGLFALGASSVQSSGRDCAQGILRANARHAMPSTTFTVAEGDQRIPESQRTACCRHQTM